MAKTRNSPKAASPRAAKKSQRSASVAESLSDKDSRISDAETRVFAHFRKYLMTPGDMLCLNAQEVDSMRSGLDVLVEQEMLVPERMGGAYCLTAQGFAMMNSLAVR